MTAPSRQVPRRRQFRLARLSVWTLGVAPLLAGARSGSGGNSALMFSHFIQMAFALGAILVLMNSFDTAAKRGEARRDTRTKPPSGE